MRSMPMIVLGLVFAAGGLLLAWLTFRQPKQPPTKAPVKKSELREQEAERKDAIKLRIGAAILVAFGILLMIIA